MSSDPTQTEAAPAAERSDPADELATLQADPKFRAALLDANHPGHQHAVDRWSAVNHAVTGEVAPEVERPQPDVTDTVQRAAHASLADGEPPLAPEGYEIPTRLFGPAERSNPQTMAMVEAFQGEAHSAGLPTDLVRSLALQIASVRVRPSRDQRHATARSAEAQLREEFGGEFDELMKAADALVGELPVLDQLLGATGLADDPSVVRALMLHAQRKGGETTD